MEPVACVVCNRAATDKHHVNHKRMGGRGVKAPKEAGLTVPLCRECHAAHHDRAELEIWTSSGYVWCRPTGKHAKRIHRTEGNCFVAGSLPDWDAC